MHLTQEHAMCVCIVDRCLSFCPFSFGHCIVCPLFTDSDYPYDIFKLFLPLTWSDNAKIKLDSKFKMLGFFYH
jgi:hypothetical protein